MAPAWTRTARQTRRKADARSFGIHRSRGRQAWQRRPIDREPADNDESSLFEAAQCKLDRTAEFGIVNVVYRPDGRLAQLGVEQTLLKAECVQAMTALARLTLEHQTRKPAPGTPEFLVLPITTEYVDCADREPREFTEPGRVGQNIIEPPRKVRDVRPTYPPALQRQRVSGAVILEGVISTTGCVSEVSVLKGVAPAMDFAALRAVSSWLFTPTLLDGKPVPVIMTVTVNFEIG
jgi:TonB family C-terminal domain